MDPRIEIASETFLFRGVPKEEIAAALARDGVYEQHFLPGETVFSPSDKACRLGLILSGSLEVFKTAGSSELLVSILHPGQLLGAASLFSERGSFVTTVRAKQNAHIVFFTEDCIRRLLAEDARLTENYIRYLTSRIHYLTARLESVASPGAVEKLYQYLLQNAQGNRVQLTLSYSALATSLGISRASLYRALETLERSGRIAQSGKIIQLQEETPL